MPFEAEQHAVLLELACCFSGICNPSGSVEDDVIAKVMREAIRKAVMELPLKLRGAVVLFYMEDMGIGDIARTLQISEGTVKSRLHNAKKKLRERLALYE